MEIQEIKQRLTLAMLLQHYGLKADKQNRLKCPFHNDKTPSLQLYYKTPSGRRMAMGLGVVCNYTFLS